MQSEKPKDTEDSGKGTDLATVGAKAIDIAIGLASLGVEAAEYAAKYLAEKGPEWVADLEERGRPVREQISNAVRGDAPPPPQPEDEAEISALERRIRELEGLVGSSAPVTTVPTVPVIPQTMMDVDDDVPTGTVDSDNPGATPSPLQPFIAPDIDDDNTEPETDARNSEPTKDTPEGTA